jgi:beta-lactamase superfamily II metal-dependent hydrolase
MSNGIRYAAFPSVVVYDRPKGKANGKAKPVQHLLWGDWMTLTGKEDTEHVEVHARGCTGWIGREEAQEDRLLEVVFVDIGQGDGCLIITPDDRKILVDAGAGDNMIRYLNWRFRKFAKAVHFDAVVISHPDQDHYNGFTPLFKAAAGQGSVAGANVSIDAVYHNGLVERDSPHPPLGQRVGSGNSSYVTDLVQTRGDFDTLIGTGQCGNKQYAAMLNILHASGKVQDIRMLSRKDQYLPGFEPHGGASTGPVFEVLGPVADYPAAGPARLRWFGDVGKTKNGHSIVLRVVYGDVRLLLGGDLNIPAERHLLEALVGRPVPAAGAGDQSEEAFLSAARRSFEVDIAKACHHGSADFTDLFLRAVNPLATVISSGDDEPHAHPRADSLGAVGRWGRGRRPLVFSTELSRSAREVINNPYEYRRDMEKAWAAREAARKAMEADGLTEEEKAACNARYVKADGHCRDLSNKIERSIAVYGAINLRTDGRRVVMAYKKERPQSNGDKWDIYALTPDTETGRLVFKSKHEKE